MLFREGHEAEALGVIRRLLEIANRALGEGYFGAERRRRKGAYKGLNVVTFKMLG